jgi:hypothetical protein
LGLAYPEAAEVVDETTMKMGYDVRVDSMRVIAIHEPAQDDELMCGDPFVHKPSELYVNH